MSEQHQVTVPMCPRTKRHRSANPRPLDRQDDGTWQCGNCGFIGPHKPEYPSRSPGGRKDKRKLNSPDVARK